MLLGENFRQGGFFGDKPDGERIDAVTGVFLSHAFTLEDMSQMSVAPAAADFGSSPVRIGKPLHGIGEMLVKCRPAASRIEFCFRGKKRTITPAANECTFFIEIVIFTRKRRLGAMTDDDG